MAGGRGSSSLLASAGEVIRFSFQALSANRLRTFLTALGLVIGNAAVILVVTISLTGRDYILEQIQRIGSNLIYASYEAGNNPNAGDVVADYVKIADMDAVRQILGARVAAVTGVMTAQDRMRVNGREQDVQILGSDENYAVVRNLQLLSGRFLDPSDTQLRQRVALLTDKLARRLYGSQSLAVGQTMKIFGLQFTVVGTFKERTETYGLSEIRGDMVLIPITVLKNFVPVERIDPMYVKAHSAAEVPEVTHMLRTIIESRHRPGAKYNVQNLAAIVEAAENVSVILTVVLMLVSSIALLISGIGIMNIMLVTVTERTREIGVRMAVGASRRAVLAQFLSEAVLISVLGGMLGIGLGLAVPLGVRYFVPEARIPVSALSALIAFLVSVIVGLVFGILPANRAARLSPTEALRYE
ncbi:MAG: ABC transporter permease [Bryobacteraceae bacterium]|nr:ABC transporter permease [Bryobacteraceae bacterium]